MTQPASLDQLRPADLPSPPQAALQILRACARDDVSSHELSTLAEKDPVLTAELLRVVNTPFFGLARKVQSLSHAVTILGQRTLRNLVLCLSVRDAIGKEAIPGLDTAAYWEDSLRRAVSARLLAPAFGVDADDAFTAGLLQDFGLLVLFYLRPEMAAHQAELRGLDPDARLEAERHWFGHDHTDTLSLLAGVWDLPEELGRALGAHHDCDGAGAENALCRILYCADWMNAIFSATDKAAILARARQLLQAHGGMDEDAIDRCLNTLASEMEAAARSLGLHIESQPDFDDILRQANVKLAEANLSYQELTWKLEQTLKERDALAAELDKELQLAREIQESLLPKDLSEDFPVTGLNVSARQLSGDFYDYFVLRDGRIYFNLADVSGKGVHAALLMAKTSSLFHCLGKHIHEPDKLLAHINNELCETAIRGMFVTMIAGIYDPASGELKLVNAGNPPALLIRPGGRVQAIEATASPLGILPGTPFPLAPAVQLEEQDCLYLFSDGATEGYLDDSGEMLGLQGLLKLILSLHELPPRQQLNAIVGKFRAASATLHDDITIMLIEGKRRHA